MIRRSRLSIAIQALEDIIDPIGKIKREMKKGYYLNSEAAKLENDPAYLKMIASQALGEIKAQGAS